MCAQILLEVAGDGGTDSLKDYYDMLVEPPQVEMGHLAFGCFKLAKALKKAPPQIAQQLAEKIVTNESIERVQATGPYLNFFFSAKAYGEKVLEPILNDQAFERQLTEGTPRTMIEYSQPNTHKEVHVGHMRNISLGQSLVNLLKYSGYDVLTATFPGDVGTHVAKCLWYLKKFEDPKAIPEQGKGEWLGQIYSKAHLLLEDQIGTEKEEENRRELTAILKELEAKKGPYFELWQATRQWSIDLMKSVYKWAGVTFDYWYWESDVDSESVALANKLYQEGKLVKSEGAIGMNLEEEGLGFCLLLKSDGTGLYATKDLELARRKFQDVKVDVSLYVVDMRQALHFKQVFKTLERLGFEQAQRCVHLQYNYVELPDGAMSSRKGNIVPLMRLVTRMEETVKNQYLHRYQGEWSQEEIDLVASQVAQGAIKYGMLRMDPAKKIVFNMEEWLKIEGESGPFVQYSGARIHSLLKKQDFNGGQPTHWTLLVHPAETALMQHLLFFNSVVLQAAQGYRPSTLCTYVYELAKKFNYFYHECQISQAEPSLKQARLALSKAVGSVLSEGLALLGIPSPAKM